MTVEEYALKINLHPEKLLDILKEKDIGITEFSDILDNNLIFQLNSYFSNTSSSGGGNTGNSGGVNNTKSDLKTTNEGTSQLLAEISAENEFVNNDVSMGNDSGINLDPVKIARAYKCLIQLSDLLSDVNYGILDNDCNKVFSIDGNFLCSVTNYSENGARIKDLSNTSRLALSETLKLLDIDITFSNLIPLSEEETTEEEIKLLSADTVGDHIFKPSSGTEFASQGLEEVGGYTIISYYDTKKQKKSIVEVVDKNGNYKTVELDIDSHVGGLGYHDKSGNLYICDGTDVSVYKMSDLSDVEHQGTISKINQFSIRDTTGTASYLTVNGNDLYVGKFNEAEKINMPLSKYNLDEDGNAVYESTYQVPFGKIQGVAVHKVDNQEYFMFAQSYGRRNGSNIIVSTLEDGEFKKVKSISVPPMLEQITVTENGKLGMVFESDSKHYVGASQVIDEVIYVDLEEIIGTITTI